MENRAKHKDCESLAFIQNCTDPKKFKYHCLINEFENAFIEVCAGSYYILLGRFFKTMYIIVFLQFHFALVKCVRSNRISEEV